MISSENSEKTTKFSILVQVVEAVKNDDDGHDFFLCRSTTTIIHRVEDFIDIISTINLWEMKSILNPHAETESNKKSA